LSKLAFDEPDSIEFLKRLAIVAEPG
jgi:hypothetical protein